jgi:hypothetical protein
MSSDVEDEAPLVLVQNEVSRLVLLIHVFFPQVGIQYIQLYIIRLLTNIIEVANGNDRWRPVAEWINDIDNFKDAIRSSFVVANGVLILSTLDDSGARPIVVFSADDGEILAGATDSNAQNSQIGLAIGFL